MRQQAYVNTAMTETELARIRHRVTRSTPFGAEAWAAEIARRLGPEASLRPRGRPRRPVEK